MSEEPLEERLRRILEGADKQQPGQPVDLQQKLKRRKSIFRRIAVGAGCLMFGIGMGLSYAYYKTYYKPEVAITEPAPYVEVASLPMQRPASVPETVPDIQPNPSKYATAPVSEIEPKSETEYVHGPVGEVSGIAPGIPGFAANPVLAERPLEDMLEPLYKPSQKPRVNVDMQKTEIIVGEFASITPTCIDPDDDCEKIIYSYDKKEWKTLETGSLGVLAELGKHTVYFKAVDSQGLESEIAEASYEVKLPQNNPPKISASLSKNKLVVGESTSVSFDVNDPEGDKCSVEYSVDGSSWKKIEDGSSLSGFIVGKHDIMLKAIDSKGLESVIWSDKVEVEQPNRTPNLSSSLSQNSINYRGSADLNASATDPDNDDVSLFYRIDNGSWKDFSGKQNLSGLSEGIHSIEVKATDSRGLSSEVWSDTLEVEAKPNRPPEVSPKFESDRLYDGEVPKLSFNAKDPDGHKLQILYKKKENGEWEKASSDSISLDDLSPRKYSITAKAIDESGLESMVQSAAIEIQALKDVEISRHVRVQKNVVIGGNVIIAEQGILEIEPGVVLDFCQGSHIISYGKFLAKGTKEKKIGLSGDGGGWFGGINIALIGEHAEGSILEYCDLWGFHGTASLPRNGDFRFPNDKRVGGALLIIGCSPTISHCKMKRSWADFGGVFYLENSNATITYNILSGGATDGGCFYIINSQPVITDNEITSCRAEENGGGFSIVNSAGDIARNRVQKNSSKLGGGFYLSNSNPKLTGNTISDNKAQSGAGFYVAGSTPELRENTITGNEAKDNGGAFTLIDSDPKLSGNRLGNNKPGDMYKQDSGKPSDISK